MHTILVPDVRAAAAGQGTSTVGAHRGIKQSTNEARSLSFCGAQRWGGAALGLGTAAELHGRPAGLPDGGQAAAPPPAPNHPAAPKPTRLQTTAKHCSTCCQPHTPQVLMVAPTAFVFNDQAAQDNTFMNSAVNSFDPPAGEGGAAAASEPAGCASWAALAACWLSQPTS